MLKLSRQAKGNRRRRPRGEVVAEVLKGTVRWMSSSVSWLLLAAVVIGVPTFVLYGWDHIATLSVFHVTAVEITGNSRVTEPEIRRVVGLDGPEVSVFSIDPHVAEERLELLPWIREARVERLLPNRVRVRVEEREIGGLVMLDQLYVADAQGVPFKPIGAEADLDRAIVTGVGDDLGALTEEDFAQIRAAFALMAQYDKLGLGAWDPLSEVQSDRLAGYTLVTERRSVRVFLGEGQLEERLSRLKEVYAELDSRGMQAATIRLDAEKSLERVPVMLKGDDDAVTR